MSDWHTLKLVTRLESLNKGLAAKLTTVFDHVKPLLGHTRPQGSEEFTDHDLAHSTRVAYRIGQFLPDSAQLNGTELYLLLLAVLLHDSGMWGPKEEVIALPADPQFKKWAEEDQRDKERPEKWKQVQEDLAGVPRRWLGELGLRHLAAAWFRERHPQRLGEYVFTAKSPTGTTLRAIIGEEYIPHIANVAIAHSWDRIRVLEDPRLEPREVGDEEVNLRLLASLLRLGDLLDFGPNRISPLLWSYLRPLNSVSEAHWQKEAGLRVVSCTPNKIKVEGHFKIAPGDAVAAEAYRLALDWIEGPWGLEREIRECASVLPNHVDSPYKERCRLGILKLVKDLPEPEGLAFGGPVTFELNRQRILELLGDEIYSSGTVFVRELMQNALDATRAQIIRDNKDKIAADPVTYPPDRPWDWPHSLTGSDRYAITVTVTEEKDSRGRDVILFSVTDQGTGMTLRQIQNHFLQVGLSYYQSQQFRDEFQFGPISRFGIGFLSCLTIAKDSRIEVHTRAAGEAFGLRLSIQMPSDQYLVTKDEALPQGTTVKVWIDPAAGHPEVWDAPPDNRDFMEKTAGCPQVTERDSSTARITVAAKQWITFPEVCLRVNGNPWGPRRVEAGPEADEVVIQGKKGKCHAVRLPLAFVSASGKHLGVGTILKRSYASGLPMESDVDNLIRFGPGFAVLHTHRGVYLYRNEYAEEELVLVWNTLRLPCRSLSAARLLRRYTEGLQGVLISLLLAWFSQTYHTLAMRSQELACLWRCLLRGHRVTGALPPIRYPVRQDGCLMWLTQDEIKLIGPVILVPFGIAWQQAVPFPLPLVGYIDNESEWNRDGCMLVVVPGHCTGLLWPQGAEACGIEPFRIGLTYVLADGTPTGAADLSLPRESLSTDELKPYLQHTFGPEQLAPYDRDGNPWKKYGLRIDGLNDLGFEDDGPTSQLANKLLDETPPLPMPPPELLRVVIPDGDSWE